MTAAAFLLSDEERAAVSDHLRRRYRDVFTPAAIESHVADYVGFTFADAMVPILKVRLAAGGRVLDIGSGFGSFVLAAREAGFDARDVELAGYEVEFARRRLKQWRCEDDPLHVYLHGDALRLDLPPDSFDAVTMWNVLEHLPDGTGVLRAVQRLLKPGGILYLICPNYAAFRLEAHYHVRWFPLFPRPLARWYLRFLAKDPAYFENEIFYRTNWGVLRQLRRLGFAPYDLTNTVPMKMTLARSRRAWKAMLEFHNPFKESVVLSARKVGG